ncbi:hypothetical protein K490DRAFT_69578 [Saccharata proteae CBS 121410]|uniref:BTB domain-containing protein n=1 Tax=Saccharata proteae CBS 121410 TaxID=1314787 RepID=A0A9P4HPL7_9PEZI|nr:hypothetical protein K490DRAFT_69578 [Saccharata proteae CBS 121410]
MSSLGPSRGAPMPPRAGGYRRRNSASRRTPPGESIDIRSPIEEEPEAVDWSAASAAHESTRQEEARAADTVNATDSAHPDAPVPTNAAEESTSTDHVDDDDDASSISTAEEVTDAFTIARLQGHGAGQPIHAPRPRYVGNYTRDPITHIGGELYGIAFPPRDASGNFVRNDAPRPTQSRDVPHNSPVDGPAAVGLGPRHLGRNLSPTQPDPLNASAGAANPTMGAPVDVNDFMIAPVGMNLRTSLVAGANPPPTSTSGIEGPEHKLPLSVAGEMAHNISRAFLENTFADFTIVGMNCELKVHRFIISAGSRYMARACRIGHNERVDKKMHLTTDDPEILKQMVAFMYGINPSDRQLPPSSQGPEVLLVRYANLYEIGGRFEVNGLPRFARDQLHRLLNIRTDLKWSARALLKLIDYVYHGARLRDGKELRMILVRYFRNKKTIERLMQEHGVKDQLSQRGEFLADVYFRLADDPTQHHGEAGGQALPTGNCDDAWF